MTKRAIAPLALDLQRRADRRRWARGLRLDERLVARAALAGAGSGATRAHGRQRRRGARPTRSWSTTSRRRRSPTCRHDDARRHGAARHRGQQPARPGTGAHRAQPRDGPARRDRQAHVRGERRARRRRAVGGPAGRRAGSPAARTSCPRPRTRRRRSRSTQLTGPVADDPRRGRRGRAGVRRPAAGVAAGRWHDRATGPVRVFGFDRRYQQHYPSIRVVVRRVRARAPPRSAPRRRGALAPGRRADRSSDAPRARRAAVRCRSAASRTSRGPRRSSPAASRASSRTFLYVPDALVVQPGDVPARDRPRVPARPARRAAPRSRACRCSEADVLRRPVAAASDPAGRVRADPGDRAGDPARRAPDQAGADRQHLEHAPGRARRRRGRQADVPVPRPARRPARGVPRRLRRPASWPATQRREQANLRLRGAHRGHLLRMLGYRTVAFAERRLGGRHRGRLRCRRWRSSAADSLFEASAGELSPRR